MTPEQWRKTEALDRAALEVSGEHADSDKTNLIEPAPLTQLLTPGAQLGPYRVEAKIGEGGMGEVYRAKDTRLNRTVAVKASAAQFSERFEREANVIAALNHPNICQIYDVGPNYLVMEYIDGAPIISSDRPQPLLPDQALRFALQIASALEDAHAKGVIHRDLKPANILVTKAGVVKLLDFGLAKQSIVGFSRPDDTRSLALTQVGTIMGTPAYMSPEQAEGKSADARSDIFSLGAVLYEMLSGKRAFSGNSAAAIMGAVLHKNPDPFAAPPALQAIVRKCLAKAPDERFQTATELRQSLERASAKTSPTVPIGRLVLAAVVVLAAAAGFFAYQKKPSNSPRINSIVVMPLEIRSNDPEAEYMSDGITESVGNSLARLPSLRVVPHSVADHYKGKALDLPKIREALGVEAVLSGRITQRGGEITVGVELDDVRSGKQLWGEQYNRKVSQLLAVQTDIAREVSQRLRSETTPADQQRMAKGSTSDPEAYQLYLKGKYHTSKFTKDEFEKGIEFFNRAIKKDPNYGLAYGGLAYHYILQDDWYLAPKESATRAKAAVESALRIDESNPEAHLALAMELHWYEWDWPAAEREFKRAIALSPNYADALCLYSWFLADMGRKEEAAATAVRAKNADPLSLVANLGPGSVSVFTRQWSLAEEQLKSAIDLDKTYWLDHVFLGRVYEQQGLVPQAIAEFEEARKLDPEHSEIWSALGHAYAVQQRTGEARKVLDHLKELALRGYVASYNVAVIYAGLGDKDQTFAWLERSFAEKGYYMPVYLPTDSRLDYLRPDPRFIDIERRMALPKVAR